jgi:predicted CXXCH cytochrome family protein
MKSRNRAGALWVATACATALGAAFACRSTPSDFHESDEVKSSACVSCHTAAFSAAKNPLHVNQLPQTCQDCHVTKGWVPSSATGHPFWPLQNKHVGVSCAACHSKGYKVGDTPKDCVGCHRKDYDSAQNPRHAAEGKDVFPLDCTTCHSDSGFKPSSFKHPTPLEGRHFIAPCVGCHTGSPPRYKGTPTECYACHASDADTRAVAKLPSHATFPRTCLNCHLMSGWVQGPPLGGLHPEAKFPIQTGVHADPRMTCLDCHKLEKGLAAGGANTDCVSCHLGSHVSPAIDAFHFKTPDGGTVAGYPQGASTTNFCLQCHTKGQHL